MLIFSISCLRAQPCLDGAPAGLALAVPASTPVIMVSVGGGA